MMKLILFFLVGFTILFADIMVVSTKNIKYKQNLDYGDLKLEFTEKKIHCTMFDKEKLLKNNYQAIRYIPKNKPICNKDVQEVVQHRVSANFGSIIIEKDGEYLGETNSYIKIKKSDGSVERINKNGTY